MSTEYVEKRILEVRAEAESLNKAQTRNMKMIDEDTRLNEETKKEERAKLTQSFKAKIRELHQKENKLITDEIAMIESRFAIRLGSSGSDIIATRDAADRVDKLETAEDAEKMMNRALRTDDRSLSHALFRRSLDENWSSVFNAFKEANPDTAALADELAYWTALRDRGLERAINYMTL